MLLVHRHVLWERRSTKAALHAVVDTFLYVHQLPAGYRIRFSTGSSYEDESGHMREPIKALLSRHRGKLGMAVEVRFLEIQELRTDPVILELFLHCRVLLLPIQSMHGCR